MTDLRLRLAEEKLREACAAAKADEYGFYDLWDLLVVANEAIKNADEDTLDSLTSGQQLMSNLGTLHAQVNNGGIEQFFWNCPELIFDALENLETLGFEKLLHSYMRTLDALLGQRDEWMRLKDKWNAGTDRPDMATFLESREVLDLDWFNSEFYGKWGGYGGKLESGAGDELAQRVIEYVEHHPEEYIRP